MSNLIKIIDKDLEIKEWRNERVVTIYDIAMLHDRKPNEVTKIFNRNISKFIENEHYFIISKKEFFERFKNFQNYIPNNVKEIVLFTESGYLRVVKPMTDDLSWKVQDVLIGSYFKLKELISNVDLLKLNVINATTEVDRMLAFNKYQIEYVQPLEIKAEYTDKVLSSDGTLTVKEIAQDFGKTANWLNKILNTLGIQYKQGSKWHLYAKYKDLGLVKEITVYDEENDRNFTRMKWTQKGREFIHNLLRENEIIG